ncbi:rhomboid family intramembrane serine protease [Flavobacterium litorale]|uniref:Rhomboid family intramembrane serine protease n=1 Tax=Flavobacterium litorale TaxID=2856519 RepID=A0ABX8V6J2_9FLAO|nr:rhomboid family intramembrane serine protease [Flavobacterium litorale]QYJ68435.1 rhomboid family intramembrane serine protease [Flavobacterium litorale]
MMRITDTVKQLIIINVIFFIGTQFIGTSVAYNYLALHFPQSDDFKVWQLLTHMFMHGGITHILFNMFGLWMFGSALELQWGTKKLLFFYVSCGLGAALLHLGVTYFEMQSVLEGANNMNLSSNTLHQILNIDFLTDSNYSEDLFKRRLIPILQESGKVNLLNQESYSSLINGAALNQRPMLGASGALYGIIVAFAFMFPNAELMLLFLPIPIKAKYFVPGLLAVDLFLGLKGQSVFGGAWHTGIAHFAHLGGALIGFVMMWYWKKNQFNNNRWN